MGVAESLCSGCGCHELRKYCKHTCAVAGVNPKVKRQLDRTETTQEILGKENVYVSTTTLRESTLAAYDAALRWLQEMPAESGVSSTMK